MSELRNPKLEIFARALLSNIAAGMGRVKAAHEAALTAGYKGKTAASNARKYAGRKDVKARMQELAAPMVAKADAQITATLEWAEAKLIRIAAPDLGDDAIRTPDQLKAVELLARFKGWLVAEKRDVTVHDGNQLSDDELARIIADGGRNNRKTKVDS